MCRKIIALWLSLAMVLSFVVVLDVIIDFTPPVEGGVIRYVNETGTGGAYTKIQDAINASSDGDTVFVYNGTYYEHVVVNKTINLTGEDKINTIIDGGDIGNVMLITANFVNVSRVTIYDGGNNINDAGIKVNSNFNNIYAAKVTSSYCCIYINFSNGNNITNTTIDWCTQGIYLCYSKENDLIDNFIEDSGVGIVLNNSDKNNLTGNEFHLSAPFFNNGITLFSSRSNNIIGNIIPNTFVGIGLRTSEDNIIKNNNISECWTAIDHVSSSENKILSNNISNSDIGIHLKESIGIKITNNTMIGNGIYISGDLLEYWDTHIINISNTINGKPIYYWKNQTGGIVPPGAGEVILANCKNIKIENQELTIATIGIELGFSSNNSIIGNNVSLNYYHGIRLFYSTNNNITGNSVCQCRNYGIHVDYSDENNVSGNNASFNGNRGLVLYFSNNNNVTSCNISNNDCGISIASSKGNKILFNNVLLNDFEGIFLSDSNNNILIGNNASYSSEGILIEYSNDNKISRNKAYWNYWAGIRLDSSNWNNITDNNIGLCTDNDGIRLYNSSKNNITNNTAWSNSRDGICLLSSDRNNITGNNLISNDMNGIYLLSSEWNNITGNNVSSNYWRGGIFLQSSWWNTIINNIALSNFGSGIYLRGASNNIIKCNDVTLNDEYGIYITSSIDNRIYHNNIISNTNQAYDDRWENNRDNGYPLGGNYWSDYGGVDNLKGPNQNIPGSDGIGDMAYSNIDGGMGAEDRYPLWRLYSPLENYTILKPGWYLISIPLIQEEQNLTRVLGSIDGWYDAVQWYDNEDMIDPWKHHKVGKPFGNDLSVLNETMGFWIHITQPGDTIFQYNGTQPTVNQKITLHPGWNLVGYPSLTSYNRTKGLNNLTFGMDVDSIWTYNAATQKWKELGPSDYFEIGKGYWIHAKIKCTWEVPI